MSQSRMIPVIATGAALATSSTWWPDQRHRTARLDAGTQTARPPLYVLRFQPLAAGVAGR